MAARKSNLRAVAKGEKPQRRLKKSITQAAEGGDGRELLVAMRERVAKAVEDPNCPPRDLAALTRRLQEIGREIAAIDERAKQEAVEDAEGAAAGSEEWNAEAL